MNNEPVAWQGLTAEEIATIPNDEFRLQKVEKILKERNTHPAKTLTDEEIADYLQKKIDHLWKMTESNMKMNLMNIMDDIRLETIGAIKPVIAILRKAQEK